MKPQQSSTRLKSSLVICFTILFIVVSTFGFVLTQNFHYVEQRTVQMNQTMAAVGDIQELKASYKSAESAIRLVFLRDKEEYLDDYYKGWEYPQLIDDIRKDVEHDADNADTLKKLDELDDIMDQRFSRFDEVFKIWRAGGRPALDALRAQGLNIGLNLSLKTDAILKSLLDIEVAKQDRRQNLFHDGEKRTTQGLALLVSIAVLMFAFTGFVIWKLIAREEYQKYLARLAEGFEKQVTERTQELLDLNKEMESFSYSVSHDLRAPLRAIEGFSNIIMEDFADKLGSEGSKRVKVIISNVRQMGQLIDDILAFSRLGRKDILKTNTDLNKMAANAFEEVRRSIYFRGDETIQINDLGFAHVDSGIFRQVFTNLIGNAVKFTSKKEKPEIVVGALGTTPQTYFIRDNGVGFDMKHANKLFNVFQRLHSNEEFDGTGVGLAIVKKIITKHGGTIRVESSPGAGATFYFSLP